MLHQPRGPKWQPGRPYASVQSGIRRSEIPRGQWLTAVMAVKGEGSEMSAHCGLQPIGIRSPGQRFSSGDHMGAETSMFILYKVVHFELLVNFDGAIKRPRRRHSVDLVRAVPSLARRIC